MKIISVVFDYYCQDKYKKLATVLEYSANKHCPDADFELVKIKAPVIKTGKSKSFTSNTVKLEIWLDKLKSTDENVIFMDCDMLVLKDISDIFNHNFDIAYTKRTKARIPYNGGIVFVHNNENSIKFMEIWKDINNQMFNNRNFHNIWHKKYAGMNQSAFGYILENKKYDANLKVLPCAVWNACNEDWHSIDEKTRVVHIKGGLRRSVLNYNPGHICKWQRAALLWQRAAVECGLIPKKKVHIINTERKDHKHLVRVKGLRRRRRRA